MNWNPLPVTACFHLDRVFLTEAILNKVAKAKEMLGTLH